MRAVPAVGLRGRFTLSYMRWVERKVARGASGDLCITCGHDARCHIAINPRQERKNGVPRGRCYRCELRSERPLGRVELGSPSEVRLACVAFEGLARAGQ
jgi:hypothetical protein